MQGKGVLAFSSGACSSYIALHSLLCEPAHTTLHSAVACAALLHPDTVLLTSQGLSPCLPCRATRTQRCLARLAPQPPHRRHWGGHTACRRPHGHARSHLCTPAGCHADTVRPGRALQVAPWHEILQQPCLRALTAGTTHTSPRPLAALRFWAHAAAACTLACWQCVPSTSCMRVQSCAPQTADLFKHWAASQLSTNKASACLLHA